MKINIGVGGYEQNGNTDTVHANVSVEFDGPVETITFTVIVKNDPDQAIVESRAISRSKALARLFCKPDEIG